jgi:hypothetical protein
MGRLLTAAALAGMSVACGAAERAALPLAPSSALTLTVRVHERSTERPIAGALVQHDGNRFYTNVFGESAVPVGGTVETTVTVSAPSFLGMSASGILHNDERWTFYLAPEPAP